MGRYSGSLNSLLQFLIPWRSPAVPWIQTKMGTCAPSKGLTVTTSELTQNKKRWDQSRVVLWVLMVNLGQKLSSSRLCPTKSPSGPPRAAVPLFCVGFAVHAVTEIRRGAWPPWPGQVLREALVPNISQPQPVSQWLEFSNLASGLGTRAKAQENPAALWVSWYSQG